MDFNNLQLVEIAVNIIKQLGARKPRVVGTDPTQIIEYELSFDLAYGFGECDGLDAPAPETIEVKVLDTGWAYEFHIGGDERGHPQTSNVDIEFLYQPQTKRNEAMIHRPTCRKYNGSTPELWSNNDEDSLHELVGYILYQLIFSSDWTGQTLS